MYLLPETFKFPKENFKSMVFQPYELKFGLSELRVKQWHDYWNGDIYVSFSGGLDSTILAYVTCKAYMRFKLSGPVTIVFCDTGVEFPEIRNFVKEYVEWLRAEFPKLTIKLIIVRPKMTFKRVCETEGFPIASKEISAKVRKLKHGKLSQKYRNYLLNGDERGKFGMLAKRWQFLVNQKFDVSEKCCNILKKEPLHRFERETGLKRIVGITQDESMVRENQYNHTGCNIYEGNTIKSQPIAFWNSQDVLRYKVENKIPVCSVYGKVIKTTSGIFKTTGEDRTGCVVCGFGCHLEKEPNRLQRLSCSKCKGHKAMYDFAMKIENNGVTYKEALEISGIATETWENIGQMRLFEREGEIENEHATDYFNSTSGGTRNYVHTVN